MSHLKALRVPKTWHIERKAKKYVSKPVPGSYSYEFALPLVLIVRDMLKYVQSAREFRKLVVGGKILLNGKITGDDKTAAGLFDVIGLQEGRENYRVVLDSKGRLSLAKVSADEAKKKICKVVGKRKVKDGKIQISLHDGRTLLGDGGVNIGDGVVLSLPDGKVTQNLELKKGNYVYMIKGKHASGVGVLSELTGGIIILEDEEKNKITTLKKYAFVVGEDKPLITLKASVENESR